MTGVNLTDPIVLESLEIAEERVRLYLKENDSTREGKAGDGEAEILKPESEVVVHSNPHPANDDGPSMADDGSCINANGEASRLFNAKTTSLPFLTRSFCLSIMKESTTLSCLGQPMSDLTTLKILTLRPSNEVSTTMVDIAEADIELQTVASKCWRFALLKAECNHFKEGPFLEQCSKLVPVMIFTANLLQQEKKLLTVP